MLALLVAVSVGAVTGAVLTPALVGAATRWGLYDRHEGARHVHPRPVPFVGGVAVFLAMAAGLAAVVATRVTADAVPRSAGGVHLFATVLVGGGVLLVAGLADDVLGLRPIQKLLIQSAAGLAVYAAGLRVELLDLRIGGDVLLGGLSLPFTILWVVGVTNAFNLIDGLDGLATGVALVTTGTIAAAALALGNTEAAVVCGALLGALLAFLPHNLNPARIFLGNAGSQFVGFLLAILSIHGSLKSATAVMMLLPLFALAVPLLDVTTAIARRWLRGSPILEADARHLHHRLVAIGLTHSRAAVVLYVVAGCFALLGLSLTFAPAATVLRLGLVGGAFTALLVVYGIRVLRYHEFVEAGAALASGVMRVRRVVRRRIRAREIAHAIPQAPTLQHLNRMLAEATDSLGFLGIEVDLESSAMLPRLERLDGDGARAWRLDFPVMPRRASGEDSYVLRIWCAPDFHRSFGAEGTAGILAPTIESWFAAAGERARRAETELARAVTAADAPRERGPVAAVGRGDARADALLPR